MDGSTSKLFEVIFQEAHVIDFDFSHWDRRLRLVVVGGLVGENFSGQGPLHNVDFVGLREFHWLAGKDAPLLTSGPEHLQWVIMESQIARSGEFHRFRLTGFGATPSLEIECRELQISELDPKVVDRVNPHWNRSSSPLARPGFEDLLTLRR